MPKVEPIEFGPPDDVELPARNGPGPKEPATGADLDAVESGMKTYVDA